MAEIEPPKGDDNQLLDELLGIDPRAFEDEEHTQVFRSDPPPPDQEEDAPTGIPGTVAPRALPLPASAPVTIEVPSAAESLAALPLPPPPVVAPPPAVAPAPPPRRAAPAVGPAPPRRAAPAVGPAPPLRAAPAVAPAPPLRAAPAVAPAPSSRAAPSVAPAARDEAVAEERVTMVTVEPGPVAEIAAEHLPDESAHAELVPPVADIATSSGSNNVFEVPFARDANDPLIGELVDGRYRVLRVLGVGGIGLVYLCQHEVLEKPVAIKVLRREYVLHDDLNERFLNEARASSAIKSPRIVDTLDVGTLPDGAPYFVMEYVEGETLAALLDREGAIDLTRAIDISKQMAEGLDAAHAAGVIHRDLKPENVFLAPQPDGALFVKIFDFGIAKVARARKRLTYAGAVFGTPHYMSPEQARGDEVDQRSDLYALGVMMFEMLTGKVPFDGEDPLAVMSQHVDRVPPLMSSLHGVSVPPVLEAIVSRCLAKDARDRYSSANELLADLVSVPVAELAAAAPSVRVASAPAPAPSRLPSLQQPRAETLHAHVVPTAAQPGKRNRVLWGGLAVAGIVASGVVVWAAQRDTPAQRASASSPELAAGHSSASSPAAAARMATVAPQKRDVHIVLSPIDSHVFRGEEDLGPMPVSVQVEDGSPVTLTVRRKGYSTRKIVLDGSETRVVVGLLRAEPPPTVGSKLQSLFKKKAK